MYGNGSTTVAQYPPTTGGVYKSPETERILVLDSATNDVQKAIERLVMTTQLARNIADSVFGSRPQPGGLPAASPPPLARADGLRSSTATLHEAITALESEIERFRDI